MRAGARCARRGASECGREFMRLLSPPDAAAAQPISARAASRPHLRGLDAFRIPCGMVAHATCDQTDLCRSLLRACTLKHSTLPPTTPRVLLSRSTGPRHPHRAPRQSRARHFSLPLARRARGSARPRDETTLLIGTALHRRRRGRPSSRRQCGRRRRLVHRRALCRHARRSPSNRSLRRRSSPRWRRASHECAASSRCTSTWRSVARRGTRDLGSSEATRTSHRDAARAGWEISWHLEDPVARAMRVQREKKATLTSLT